MGKLDGKVALVTGSDSGTGQAVAEHSASAGADVVVTYRSGREGVEEMVRRVEAAGRRALLRQADVGDEAAVEALFTAIAGTFGALDSPNAGADARRQVDGRGPHIPQRARSGDVEPSVQGQGAAGQG